MRVQVLGLGQSKAHQPQIHFWTANVTPRFERSAARAGLNTSEKATTLLANTAPCQVKIRYALCSGLACSKSSGDFLERDAQTGSGRYSNFFSLSSVAVAW